jgi:hypothetical protein
MAFPSLKQMEDEVVSMGLGLLHGPDGSVGNITSGGTDSITMAVKTARDYARKVKGVEGRCNIVAPWSAHPAFDKAAKMMEIEMRRVPCADLLADVAAIALQTGAAAEPDPADFSDTTMRKPEFNADMTARLKLLTGTEPEYLATIPLLTFLEDWYRLKMAGGLALRDFRWSESRPMTQS